MTPAELTELDRMMAEFLTGAVVFNVHDYLFDSYETLQAFKAACKVSGIDDWHPTRDIAQAMLVAEKINGLELHKSHSHGWRARFSMHQIEFHPLPSCESPALAICLAAKAWLEAREK